MRAGARGGMVLLQGEEFLLVPSRTMLDYLGALCITACAACPF